MDISQWTCSASNMIVHHSDFADKSYIPDFVSNNRHACNPNVTEKKLESLSENVKDIEKAFKKDKEALQEIIYE